LICSKLPLAPNSRANSSSELVIAGMGMPSSFLLSDQVNVPYSGRVYEPSTRLGNRVSRPMCRAAIWSAVVP
jgi:hypothetical protein